MRHLPRALAERLIRGRALRRAEDLVETQAGRLRHDFEQRLRASAAEFRTEMHAMLSATVEAIEGSLARGSALRQRTAEEVASRRAALQQRLARIAEVERMLGLPARG